MIQQVLKNSETARARFEERIECVRRMVHARNRQLGQPLKPDELPDVIQDVLTIIWRKLPEFQGRSSLETWMYRISSFELMNAVRGKRRSIQKRVANSEEEIEWRASETEELPLALRFEDLYSSLERLPDVEERIVRLKHYEERTFEQIGETLGLTPSGVKHHYYRAISRLRELMSSGDSETSR